MEYINSLNRRYAVKKFDSSKKISDRDLKTLIEAVRLSPSSYGLQLYKVLVAEEPELRAELKKASWNQGQITDSSHLFIFCAYDEVSDIHIDEYINLKAETEGKDFEELAGYGDFIKSKVKEMREEQRRSWTARQTYLALGNLLNACAVMGIDACPMEGFEPEKYNKILNLKERNLTAVVIAAAGYRSDEDMTQYLPKVRKPVEELFDFVNSEKIVEPELA